MSIIERPINNGMMKLRLTKVDFVKVVSVGENVCEVSFIMNTGERESYRTEGSPEMLIRDFIMEH